MAGINFGVMAGPLSFFDTDLMDIGRKQTTINSDGSTGETSPNTPLYANVPCHVSFSTMDDPDSADADTQPIVTLVVVNCKNGVDLRNGDYITAKKCDATGNIMAVYSGLIGQPKVNQARQSATLAMRAKA